MLQTSFKTFSEATPILENVQMAKDYLLKRYATAKKIKTSEIPEETKQKILNDPKFKQVRDLTQKFPNYTPLFTKFAFEQGAEMEELQEIVDLMIQYKNNLAKDLEMPVMDYGKLEPTEEDQRPGYEVLGDDLRNIPRKVKLRKLYNRLVPEMKIQFAKATPKQIEKLEEISNQLDQLPEKDGENAWDEFTQNMKKYTDTRTYPEYRDRELAFGDIIKDADLFIEKWQESDDELVKKLKTMGAQVGWLYQKDGYIAISTRTPEALRAVAGDTNWCIRNDSTFWSYGEGRVQLVIMNKNIPVSDRNSLLGITVNKNESIHTDADRPNGRIRSSSGGTFSTLEALLKGMHLPTGLVEAVLKDFPMEADIKLAMEQFFRHQKDLTPERIIGSLINVNRGFLQGKMEEGEWERIAGVVSEIIKGTEKLKTSEFLKFFKQNGILSQSGLAVFDRVVGDDYTPEDVEEIKASSMEGFETMEYILEENKRKTMKTKPEEIERMKTCVDNKDSILDKLSKM